MGKLENKVAVITGSTRGFGLATARAYAREGAKVVIASRSEAAVERAVRELEAAGAHAAGLPVDVGEREQVEALAEFAARQFGRLDVWVNNAGMAGPYGPTVHIDPEDFVQVLKTNIFGTYYGSVAAMHRFLPRGQGKLINVLGRGDRGPVPMQNAYASTKSWMRSFTLALAEEYKDSGAGVFAYSPGLMETELMENIRVVAGYEERLKPLETVMRMWANPPDVPARKMVWLASTATDGKTGLYERELGLRRMLSGLFKEGLRRLSGQAPPERDVRVISVRPHLDVPAGAER